MPEIKLTDIANGGQALGRHGTKTVFVPFAIPGETVDVKITDDRGRYAFAEGEKVIEASADRVIPRCIHFGPNKCGGCQWQHIDYTAQLALKTDIVSDQLERIGNFKDANIRMAIGSSDPWYYGHHTTLYPLKDGSFGYKATDGERIIPITECHIITPELLALIEQMDFELDTLTRVKIMDDGRDDRMLVLSTTDDEAPGLEVDFKSSVNFLLSDNVPVNLIGALHMTYEIQGRQYRVTAGSFFRSNVAQIPMLIKVIGDMLNLTGKETMLDLYSGVGVLAGAFAPQTSLITCVESYPTAVADAEKNLETFDHIDLIEGNVADVLEALSEEHYDVALLDPPPDGLGNEVIDALEHVQPRQLIYISSDAATLARDAKKLLERYGYQLQLIQPIDFEPQTYRVVSVAHLVKGK